MESGELDRFIDIQRRDYKIALEQIRGGRKTSHWMWYIFPQVKGLGFTEISVYYSIKSLSEAQAYLNHPILGLRLREISEALLNLPNNNIHDILGSPDDMKLRSSMTLFSGLHGADPVFTAVLDKFFGGKKDHRTLEILDSWTK